MHIRKRIAQIGKIPDAHIVTPQGIICIDSKFPLDNYRKMLETTEETEQAKFSANFRNDVKTHIDKIKTDYVKPEEGTTEQLEEAVSAQFADASGAITKVKSQRKREWRRKAKKRERDKRHKK